MKTYTKKWSRWHIKNKIWIQIAISNELCYLTTGNGQRQTQLVFLGWYELKPYPGRILTINAFGLSLKLGYIKKDVHGFFKRV